METFDPDHELLHNLKKKIIAVKVGGNALTNDQIIDRIMFQIARLKELGLYPIVIHGGGIEIKELLSKVGIESQFIGGHRKTDPVAMNYIEMALSGGVNKEIVRRLSLHGVSAVGISGKDGKLAIAKRRVHIEDIDGKPVKIDLGNVGDVLTVNPELILTLTKSGYLPVISPVSIGEDGLSYNVNADMFAGHIASAIKAERFIAMTNIDGLLSDVNDPGSLIENLTPEHCKKLYGNVIKGGMIPKIDASLFAVENGVKKSHIINGLNSNSLLRILLTKDKLGTTISSL